MGLNESKGNMYSFVSHTWNTVKGKCYHDCSYCYMKRFRLNDTRFDEKELKTDLGKGNFIFVGSSCDMWGDFSEKEWIRQTLGHCRKFDNQYLFQSKNPFRFWEFIFDMPEDYILGTTIESNRTHKEMGNTPDPMERIRTMKELSDCGFSVMISIEPIMDFDIMALSDVIVYCKPEWVTIGADSKGSGLKEPAPYKIKSLIELLLEREIKVVIKMNLARLYEC